MKSLPHYLRFVSALALGACVGCGDTTFGGGDAADTGTPGSDVIARDNATTDTPSTSDTPVATDTPTTSDAPLGMDVAPDSPVDMDVATMDAANDDVPLDVGCHCPVGPVSLPDSGTCVPGSPEYMALGCHPVTGPLLPPEISA